MTATKKTSAVAIDSKKLNANATIIAARIAKIDPDLTLSVAKVMLQLSEAAKNRRLRPALPDGTGDASWGIWDVIDSKRADKHLLNALKGADDNSIARVIAYLIHHEVELADVPGAIKAIRHEIIAMVKAQGIEEEAPKPKKSKPSPSPVVKAEAPIIKNAPTMSAEGHPKTCPKCGSSLGRAKSTSVFVSDGVQTQGFVWGRVKGGALAYEHGGGSLKATSASCGTCNHTFYVAPKPKAKPAPSKPDPDRPIKTQNEIAKAERKASAVAKAKQTIAAKKLAADQEALRIAEKKANANAKRKATILAKRGVSPAVESGVSPAVEIRGVDKADAKHDLDKVATVASCEAEMIRGDIKKFDGRNSNAVAKAIEVALKGVADEFGLVVQSHKATHNDFGVFTRIELAVKAESGLGSTVEAKAYRDECSAYGLRPEWFGRSFMMDGKHCTVAGLRPANPKCPVVLAVEGNKTWTTTPSAVQKRLTNGYN